MLRVVCHRRRQLVAHGRELALQPRVRCILRIKLRLQRRQLRAHLGRRHIGQRGGCRLCVLCHLQLTTQAGCSSPLGCGFCHSIVSGALDSPQQLVGLVHARRSRRNVAFECGNAREGLGPICFRLSENVLSLEELQSACCLLLAKGVQLNVRAAQRILGTLQP